MRTRQVTVPELALIAGTRVALGAGLGLLLADRLDTKQRRAVGLTLALVGVLTTFPLAAEVLFQGSDDWDDEHTRDRERPVEEPVTP